jgi:hypothetical protein
VAQLADEAMTLTANRRVLELEEQVKIFQAERDALRAALAERGRVLASLARVLPRDAGQRLGPPPAERRRG